MSLLSGLQLARMRRTADRSLTAPGEVWRRTRVPDGKGGMTETLVRVSSGPWRLAAITTVASTEQVLAARLGGAQGWWLTAQYHTSVQLDDQIRAHGKVFEVAGFDSQRSDHVSLRVLCREVT